MKIKFIFWLITLVVCFSCQNKRLEKINYTHPISYQPQNYICYRTDSLLTIDGELTEVIWQKTAATTDFVDIQGNLKPLPTFQTNVKMLWNDSFFYFGAYMKEPHIWGKLTERDAVIFQDNDFEFFLDPNGDTHHYYELEINALNTLWDLLLLRPYREDGEPKVLDSWDIRGIQSAVHINGTLNNGTDIDSFWTLEVAIPWSVLAEMTPKAYLPKAGVNWRVNFSRVNWHMAWQNGTYEKRKNEQGKNLREENWVWSPQGYVAMHAPETWGFVQFSDKVVGQGITHFTLPSTDKIKWALRQLYYQQGLYFEQYQRYADDLAFLTLPEVDIDNYTFSPQLLMTYKGYELIANGLNNQAVWRISADGRIVQLAKEDTTVKSVRN